MSVTDNFSRYVWLFTLHSKETTVVADRLISLFCSCGFPTILQIEDKGKNIDGLDLVRKIKKEFPNIVMVNVRPRTERCNLSQTSRCVKEV